MNRQALAFLTLFSLILMLSVYYVTLPSDTTTVSKTDQNTQKLEGKEDSTNIKNADVLKNQVEKKKNEELDKNSNIVSDPEQSEDEKQKALETIEGIKDSKQMEQDIVDALKKAGYTSVVEIQDKTCIVSIFENEDNKENARKIISVVNGITGNQYLTEVTFK